MSESPQPRGAAKETKDVVTKLTVESSQLYELWRLVNAKKQQLLLDLWECDHEKLGYIATTSFQRVLQMTLQIAKEQADVIVDALPFQGKSGSVDYRRSSQHSHLIRMY